MSLSRLQVDAEDIGDPQTHRLPRARFAFGEIIDWSLCLLAISALTFSNLAQTAAAGLFLLAGALLGVVAPVRAIRALLSDWLPWLFILLALTSVAWSTVPDVSVKFAIELALTGAVALVVARCIPPHQFLSVLLCAFIAIDVVGLLMGRYALNAGAMAMLGAFGSKNAFSAAQAYLFLTSCWVLLGRNQNKLIRCIAFICVLFVPILLIAGRSADAVAPLVLALGITLVAFGTNWLPPLPRALALFSGVVFMVGIFGFAFIFRDSIFGQLLIITGKDVTLSGREYLWTRAAELIALKPLLGTGYGAFWVQLNPYAEEIWAHFQVAGRGGFNFHNLWYDMGVQLGYVGITVSALTVLLASWRMVLWALRSPSAESFFFLGFIMMIDMRSMLESEIFSQFSLSWVIFVVASYYARNAGRVWRAAEAESY